MVVVVIVIVGHMGPFGAPVLRITVQQDVIWANSIARCEIGEPPRLPDFVALINSRIALNCFHERAGFALLGRAALAEAAAAETGAQFVDRFGEPGKIMSGV